MPTTRAQSEYGPNGCQDCKNWPVNRQQIAISDGAQRTKHALMTIAFWSPAGALREFRMVVPVKPGKWRSELWSVGNGGSTNAA